MTNIVNTVKNVKKQHYVQKALIDNWSVNGMVGVGRLIEQTYFVKEHSKSPTAVFYEDYLYELVYHFSSAEKHRQAGLSVRTDANHVFKTNDVEHYCKQIEDAGLPIIRTLISELSKGRPEINLQNDEHSCLCRYLILQAIRTPKGRFNFQYNYSPMIVNEASSNEEVIEAFVSNFTYLLSLGTYDNNGFSDNYDLSASVFSHFCDLIQAMNVYVVTLEENDHNQFIISDNPCVILGEMYIWGLVMPITPKKAIVLLSENEDSNNTVRLIKCSKRVRLFILWSQFISCEKKIVFCENYKGLSSINKDIHYANRLKNTIIPIWTMRSFANSIMLEDGSVNEAKFNDIEGKLLPDSITSFVDDIHLHFYGHTTKHTY